MTRLRLIVISGVFLATALIAPTSAQQRFCNIACVHPVHQFDVAPCSHPCPSPWGYVPCHPNGDMYPCVHRMHAWDTVAC